MDCGKNIRLHFIYSVGILIGLLALVMTDRWTAHENFTEYLSNSATLISLVLGLVAIFYSFTSNSSLSQSLGTITKVSDEIVQTKQQLGDFLREAKVLEKSGSDNTEMLRTVSRSVESQVTSLQSALNDIGKKTEDLHESVSNIPLRIDAMEQKVLEANNEAISKAKAPASTTGTNSVEPTNFGDVAIRMMERGSVTGGFLIYACVLAKEKNKTLQLASLDKHIHSGEDYLYGYFIALKAAGLVEGIEVPNSENTFSIESTHPNFTEFAKKYLLDNINTRFNDNQDLKNRAISEFDRMENIFIQEQP